MKNAILELGASATKDLVRQYADELHIPPYLHIDSVCEACCANVDLAPDMNAKKKKNLLAPEECVLEWVKHFMRGYNERISVRKSKSPSTVPDQAIDKILQVGLSSDLVHVHRIMFAHRLSMSAENILGLLLEEYLFERLSPHGWAMAWGETVKSVDFCNKEGVLLQIKNRSNTENSSSNKVRVGMPIEKWYRVNATTGHYEWDKLVRIVGEIPGLNEMDFQGYIETVLHNNPQALAVDHDNPWKGIVRGME